MDYCEDHGTRLGPLPCPWPDCPNGQAGADSDTTVDGDAGWPEYTAHRVSWVSPIDGKPYYSWEDPEYPLSSNIGARVSAEQRRLGLERKEPDLVYHYTNLDGLVGIVGSRSIWLSDYSYLNDEQDVTYGLDTIRSEIDLMLGEAQTRGTEILRYWQQHLQVHNRICTASFSEDHDSLSQWRAYGPIAIGFAPAKLRSHLPLASVCPVEYDQGRQRTLARIALSHTVQAFLADRESGLISSDHFPLSNGLLELATFFKHPAFAGELEYRCSYLHGYQGDPTYSPPKRFRVAGSRLQPYLDSRETPESGWGDRVPLEIASVILGPGSDKLLKPGVREFLDENQLSHVQVETSAIPFRR